MTDPRHATPSAAQAPAAPTHPAEAWARKVDRLEAPAGARNVAGRRLMGPVQGFGKMWQKTYTVQVDQEVAPAAAIATWKANFAEFWPAGNRFASGLAGITPGDVAQLELAVGGGVKLSTGVFVLYADDLSFTLMTPEGHMFAGWISFSAEPREETTQVQVQVLMRANDPIYELGMILGGHAKEDRFWSQTLSAVASRLGSPGSPVETRTVCVDRRRQWRRAGNIWHNSMVRSLAQATGKPFRRRHGD